MWKEKLLMGGPGKASLWRSFLTESQTMGRSWPYKLKKKKKWWGKNTYNSQLNSAAYNSKTNKIVHPNSQFFFS